MEQQTQAERITELENMIVDLLKDRLGSKWETTELNPDTASDVLLMEARELVTA